MGVYLYCIKEDYTHKSSIKDREFSNEWFSLEKDGTITVKGSYKNGYAWDGCSPKFKVHRDYVEKTVGNIPEDRGVLGIKYLFQKLL